MATFVNIRQEVLQEINKLPDEKLSQLLKFIYKMQEYSPKNHNDIIDPLADFIGKIEQGNLVHNIEQDL